MRNHFSSLVFGLAGAAALGALLVTDRPAAAAPDEPDLIVDARRLERSVQVETRAFTDASCAVVEGCVDDPGARKLMRFDVVVANIGAADLVLGDPADNPGLFHFSPCHSHYHLDGFASYDLLNRDGSPVVVAGNAVVGHKQAFCLLDYLRYSPGAGQAKFNCSYQGISAGWADLYSKKLDCQWIDITGVTPGNYLLRVAVNESGLLGEADYTNNATVVPVRIRR